MSLQDRKKNSLEQLQKEIDKMSKPTSQGDDRLWKLSLDSSGNGTALIRFLDAPEGESSPWISLWKYGFKGPTGLWYIEKSLTNLNKPDPCYELHNRLWKTGVEENQNIVRKQKSKKRYTTNILVIKDPANPQNEGKVFLYEFGTKIFDMIKEMIYPKQPEDDDDEKKESINPFCFWKGCNFKMKVKTVAGYANYDDCKFVKPSPLFEGDDSKIEEVFKQEYKLQEFVDPTTFKTYEELRARLDKVLGVGGEEETKKPAKTMRQTEAMSKQELEQKKEAVKEYEDDINNEEFEALAALIEE